MNTQATSPLLEEIITLLTDSKGTDIEHIPVNNVSDICDDMLICTASSSVHARSLGESIIKLGRKQHRLRPQAEGLDEGEWVLIEIDQCLVHIMTQPMRDYYQIEALWHELINA